MYFVYLAKPYPLFSRSLALSIPLQSNDSPFVFFFLYHNFRIEDSDAFSPRETETSFDLSLHPSADQFCRRRAMASIIPGPFATSVLVIESNFATFEAAHLPERSDYTLRLSTHFPRAFTFVDEAIERLSLAFAIFLGYIVCPQ